MEYLCSVVEQPGTRTSYLLQAMLDAWAGLAGIRLCPGTAYLCADSVVQFPADYLSLESFEHLHSAGHRRSQKGYSPRLYPVVLAGAQKAWVYRWSADDPGLGFVGDHGNCEAGRLLEIIAPLNIRASFGIARLTLSFAAA